MFASGIRWNVYVCAAGPVGIDTKQTGTRIKELCEMRGLTVKLIQQALHIGSFQSVYAWFAGKTLPSLDNAYQLSNLLDVSMEELIIGAGLNMCYHLDMENRILKREFTEKMLKISNRFRHDKQIT